MNPNPNSKSDDLFYPQHPIRQFDTDSNFQFSDFVTAPDCSHGGFEGDEEIDNESNTIFSQSFTEASTSPLQIGYAAGSNPSSSTLVGNKINESGRRMRKVEEQRRKVEVVHRVAFRTRSEVDVMDDGFKWRKYGKKSVKNTPFPRNYYKCPSVGCNVKKRVERDREDSTFVITTYQGVHNHQIPSINLCYNNHHHHHHHQISPMAPSINA
ncbi:Probable WRKY transcription factor 51 [Linum grandiflorum]